MNPPGQHRTADRRNGRHPSPKDLALYAGGDLKGIGQWELRWHLRRCASCRQLVEELRADRAALRDLAHRLPESIDWDSLAEEMTANIRVGLAAAECVSPVRRDPSWFTWRPAYVIPAGAAVLLMAWMINAPSQTPGAWARVAKAVWTGKPVTSFQESSLILEATRGGVQLKQNGAALALAAEGAQPVAVSVSMQGAARARYVDDETGQVTITSVYGQ